MSDKEQVHREKTEHRISVNFTGLSRPEIPPKTIRMNLTDGLQIDLPLALNQMVKSFKKGDRVEIVTYNPLFLPLGSRNRDLTHVVVYRRGQDKAEKPWSSFNVSPDCIVGSRNGVVEVAS